MPVTDSQVTR